MNEHDATEVAYNNGYKQGARKLAEKLKDLAVEIDGRKVVNALWIDRVARELLNEED
jgi:hypothetical protein